MLLPAYTRTEPNTDLSQLPDVSEHMVTVDNPAHTKLPGMDHAHRASLHNYLATPPGSPTGDGCPLAGLQDNFRTYFTAFGNAHA